MQNCKPLTCEQQGIECGPAGDGCGGLIPDCGKCGSGLRCGGPGKPSQCVKPEVGTGCVPKKCSDLDVSCGQAGDGCGGVLNCGTCPSGQQCGATGLPSQCVAAVPTAPDGGACVKKTCEDYLAEFKNCGEQSDGCGGTIDCGQCTVPGEFCGGGGPSKCAPSGGSPCTPKQCSDPSLAGKCGRQPDGCGGVTVDSCGECTFPEICGGGGVPSVCGGGTLTVDGSACQPKTTCATGECGQIPNGCGGVLDCGLLGCPTGQTCGGAGVANRCGAPPCTKTAQATACAGKNCGSVSDGCGGLWTCGTGCTLPAICGGGGQANVCGGGVVVGDGGVACQPTTTCPANACGPIANGCGGTLDCGGCPSPQACGANGTPSQCGGGNQCVQISQATACGSKTCGYAPDGCGGSYTCGTLNGACPDGQQCGLYAPDQCGSLSGPCITTGSATTCTSDNQCCSGFCGSLGKCSASQCKNVGLACATGNDCCSGVCGTNKLCATGNSNACKASGSTCTTNTECCSKGCINNVCSTATSYCLQNNDACTKDSQCCGGSCVGATANQAGRCANTAAGGGGLSCTMSGTVVACSSTTDYACNSDCCSGSCGPNDSAPGFTICQQPSSCGSQGELCLKNADCCGNPAGGSLSCSKPGGAGDSSPLYGRCNGATACSKPGEICKTATDSCSFPNNCCEPSDMPSGNCNSNPAACCGHDNLGIPRCKRFAVCRAAGQTCETSADCCPVNGEQPPCTPDSAGVFKCGATACLPNGDNSNCTVDADCCEGNCYKQNPGDQVGKCKIPTCTPKSCAVDYPGKCGELSDGCGGFLDCGDCTFPQTCGGGAPGTPNVCGGTVCTKLTVCPAGIECGTIPDGCGGTLVCGPCTGDLTCGGGGQAYKCGKPACNQLTCTGQGLECGQTGDGCGGIATCPDCPPGQTCGGGGQANKCGAPACTKLTACPAGKNCGEWPDGCGGKLNCGTCPQNQTCGGGGEANVCGNATCKPKTCAEQGAQCGQISDGCGIVLTCPLCGPGEYCNAQNLCVGLACTAKTCPQLGVECGPTADTCGGLLDCGPCPPGEGCGAGGTPGKCGKMPCTALTCQQVGAVCGQVADGCGGLTPSCGTCAGNLSCKNGACVQACTPTTCAAAGAQCGAIADGCGGILDCGLCPQGYECGYGGQANKCGRYQPN